MILLITKNKCQHVNLIEEKLKKKRVDFYLLKTELLQVSVFLDFELNKNGFSGSIKTADRSINLKTIKSIWWFDIDITFNNECFIDDKYVSFAQQETYSLCKTIFSSLNVYHVNHPDKIIAASNKLNQLKLAHNVGFNIPNTLISSNQSQIIQFLEYNPSLIYKTLSHPTIIEKNKEFVIYTNEVTLDDLSDENSLKASLNLFQSNISKKTELRVTVVGNEVFTCEIYSQDSQLTKTDWRVYDLANVPHYPVELKNEINNKCIEITRALDLEYATIDLIIDNNRDFWFLEVNPNGLWAWIELITNLKISDAFANILINEGYN